MIKYLIEKMIALGNEAFVVVVCGRASPDTLLMDHLSRSTIINQMPLTGGLKKTPPEKYALLH